MALDVASADLAQQQELLNQLLGGANDNANTQDINLPNASVKPLNLFMGI
ncbi:hypothetical protein [Megamonas hypermegale]|nr:hypothetical protein [Megamonas hypermegale]